MSSEFMFITSIVIASLIVLAFWLRWSFQTCKPDEWLLRVRGGRLVDAGVGITFWRRPGDAVVRFTSTVQRVGFVTDALSAERLGIRIEGFLLWSVSSVGDAPFRAFTKLGLADLNDCPSDLRSLKHLLAPGQHRAFKGLLGAEVRHLAAGLDLDALLGVGEALQEGLLTRLEDFADRQGIEIEQVEIHSVSPADPSLLTDLSAEKEQRVREGAVKFRVSTAERIDREKSASATRLAQAEIAERREREAAEVEAARRQRLALEGAELDVTRARLKRERIEHEEQLTRDREKAAAQRDVIDTMTDAEARKPKELRDAEVLRFVAERSAQALASLPLREARWVSVGKDGPWSAIASIFESSRALIDDARSSPRKELDVKSH